MVSGTAPANRRARKIPIALQLYSVREDCARDLAGTLAAVAEMGYEGVEFAGFHGHSASEVRAMLEKNGLKAAGSHTGVDALLGSALGETVAFNREIGNRFIVVPGLPGEYTNSPDAWRRTADLFNEVAAQLAPHGMRLGYHNHAAEFQPLEGEIPWDILFSRAKPEIIAQMDVGHVLRAGADPLPYLERYPGRAVTVHVKEYPDEKMVGEGDVPFAEFFRLCETIGNTEWYIVEIEAYPVSPLECARKAIGNLRAMGK